MKNNKKNTVIKKMVDIEFKPIDKDIDINKKTVIKLPLDKISSYGMGFAAMSTALATTLKTVPVIGETLYRATDAAGNTVKLTQMFNDGSGLLGSVTNSANGFQQFRFHEVASCGKTVTAFNPMYLVVAGAIIQINMKLDAIKEMQQTILDYLKVKDHAEQMGDLRQLFDILNEYKYNLENENFYNNKIQLVQDIKRSADQKIVQFRDWCVKGLEHNRRLHIRKSTKGKAKNAVNNLKEYRIALYIYSFSAFLEKLLNGNFQKESMDCAIEEIQERTNEYNCLVDRCQEQIEQEAKGTLETGLLNAVSFTANFLGNSIKKTRISNNIPIDSVLINVGKDLGNYKCNQINDVRDMLLDSKVNVSQTFIDSLEETSRLYNGGVELLSNGEDVYLLPCQ